MMSVIHWVAEHKTVRNVTIDYPVRQATTVVMNSKGSHAFSGTQV